MKVILQACLILWCLLTGYATMLGLRARRNSLRSPRSFKFWTASDGEVLRQFVCLFLIGVFFLWLTLT